MYLHKCSECIPVLQSHKFGNGAYLVLAQDHNLYYTDYVIRAPVNVLTQVTLNNDIAMMCLNQGGMKFTVSC
jgi:hypothetical protein